MNKQKVYTILFLLSCYKCNCTREIESQSGADLYSRNIAKSINPESVETSPGAWTPASASDPRSEPQKESTPPECSLCPEGAELPSPTSSQFDTPRSHVTSSDFFSPRSYVRYKTAMNVFPHPRLLPSPQESDVSSSCYDYEYHARDIHIVAF